MINYIIPFKKIKASSFFLLQILLVLFVSCMSAEEKKIREEGTVILAYNDGVYRIAILLHDEKIRYKIQPRTTMPYSDNASSAVWVGKFFPYKKAIKAILLGRHYYKELRYIALSDREPEHPTESDYELFLGGATEKALKLCVTAWNEKDFDNLKKIKSGKEFRNYIKSKYLENIKDRKKWHIYKGLACYKRLSKDYNKRKRKLFLNIQSELKGDADIILKESEYGIVFSMSDILFRKNSAALTKKAKNKIKIIYSILNKYLKNKLKIEISGHTDNRGKARYNLRLSKMRAKSVYKALKKLGVPKKRMSYFGYGSKKPLFPRNKTPEERKKNRRVEILILTE